MVISEDSGTVTTCFKDFGLSRLGLKHQTSACDANALTHCATAAVNIFVRTNNGCLNGINGMLLLETVMFEVRIGCACLN